MRTNESLIPNIKSGAENSSKGKELYIESLWQCQTSTCLELIRKRPFNLNQDFADQLLKEKPRIPSDYQIVSAAHLDAIWYVFLGSGEIKGPLHILKYLEKNFDNRENEGLSMQEKLTYQSAMWSMRSFYKNDDKVKAMVDENCKHIELLAKIKS